MKIGIYGLGRFGSFWAESLSNAGYEVVAYSRSKHDKIKGVRIAEESEVLLSDILFYCVAISSFEEVLTKTKDLIGKDTIVLDTCSVKKYPSLLMEKLLPPDIYRIATHPMFGPDSGKNGLEGLPLVMCALSEIDSRYQKVKESFENMKLRVIEMTADEHDKEAAFSQGITHFIGRVMDEMKAQEYPIATKGYQALLGVKEQTCHDPFQLFLDLQKYNPYTKDMRHDLRIAIENVSYVLEEDK